MWELADQNQIKSLYLTSVTRGVVAQSFKPKAHVSNMRVLQIKLEFQNVGFKERGKPDYREKNLSEQRREPTTNSTQMRTTSLGTEPRVT